MQEAGIPRGLLRYPQNLLRRPGDFVRINRMRASSPAAVSLQETARDDGRERVVQRYLPWLVSITLQQRVVDGAAGHKE